jgi:antitoxin HicB
VRKGTIGSSFDDFLKEEGIYETVQVAAIKRVLAWQLEQAMAVQKISKSEMARRMKTSRSQLDRLLDPDNVRVQLDTVMKAAAVLGKEFRMALVDPGRKVA